MNIYEVSFPMITGHKVVKTGWFSKPTVEPIKERVKVLVHGETENKVRHGFVAVYANLDILNEEDLYIKRVEAPESKPKFQPADVTAAELERIKEVWTNPTQQDEDLLEPEDEEIDITEPLRIHRRSCKQRVKILVDSMPEFVFDRKNILKYFAHKFHNQGITFEDKVIQSALSNLFNDKYIRKDPRYKIVPISKGGLRRGYVFEK